MAALPPESTGRVWLDYTTGGGPTATNHTIMMRYSGVNGGTVVGALSVLAGLLVAPGSAFYFDGWQVTGARAAVANSVISLPQTVPGSISSFVGTGQAVATVEEQAREFRLVGRGPNTGRRGSLSIYGLVNAVFSEKDFRINRAPENIVGDYLDWIEEMDTGYLVSIGGDVMTFQNYANWQYNSYWEGELRA